jgi:hypothetical protein
MKLTRIAAEKAPAKAETGESPIRLAGHHKAARGWDKLSSYLRVQVNRLSEIFRIVHD